MENQPQRKNIRLQGYDYSQPGYYFVTICTKDKFHLFCEPVGVDAPVHPQPTQSMQPNNIGNIISGCWSKINEIYSNVQTDVFCLMPNHIHGIIIILEGVGQSRPTLQKIMQGFKSITTRMCFTYGYETIWQKGYYEHVIRNNHELQEIREYIINNPEKWINDKYYS